MHSKDFVLILGSQDRLSQNLISYMDVNSHPYFVLNESTVPTILDIPCGQYLKDFDIEFLNGDKLSFEDCTGILANHFSVSDSLGSKEKERFWSEWNAFFGGAILSTHKNVINPPSAGSWCGEFPTIFRQIEILGAFVARDFVLPGLESYFGYFCGNTAFEKSFDDGAFYIPYEYWEKELQRNLQSMKIHEVSCCFVEKELVFEGTESVETKKTLSNIASFFAEQTNSRIGEIGVFILEGKHYFRYALTRPVLNSFRGANRYQIIKKIYTSLIMCEGRQQ